MLRKAERASEAEDLEHLRDVIRAFASDIPKIKKHVKKADSGLIENISLEFAPDHDYDGHSVHHKVTYLS